MYDAGRRARLEDERLARHPASYTQQYFAQEKAIRAPGDEAAVAACLCTVAACLCTVGDVYVQLLHVHVQLLHVYVQ